ncbi:TonB-dependent receptor [Pseudoflavitalea sp. X16]|uniref:SusC/RagA family TonB-linked outer membrane protein n=1 Tax=Paraflavitalea devenefica TaxID=2716334 RepID=UPI0014227C09|nr:TonB-dependent receptor [Paraflavitalea devenefica]NII28465.1 TonB-dependent receptor [Paraflavitalea devenefica]
MKRKCKAGCIFLRLHFSCSYWLMALLITGFLPVTGRAQSQPVVTGRVVEAATNKGLKGVTVSVKNTSRKSATSEDGRYTIQAASADVLVFTFISMKVHEEKVEGRTVVNVGMIPKDTSLNAVVVVGYNSVKRGDLTGAVAQANMQDISKAPVGSFAEALAGRLAGVQVSSSDGQPGGGMNIVIRGPGSLTQSISPLYVIDGFPVEDIDPATINPDDIESISILKDASSTAIYGSRAANGVVLIQTKKGKAGKAVVSLSASSGFQLKRKEIALMSPYEFVKYQLERFPTAPESWRYIAGGKSIEDYKNVQGTNYQDYVFTQGKINIYNLAVRGGNEQTKYSVSGSYFDQEGIVINTGLKRYTGRISLDHNISNRIKAGFIAGYTNVTSWGQTISSSPSSSTSSYVMFRTWAYRPVGFPDAGLDLLAEETDESSITSSDFRINPVIDLENQYQYDYNRQLEGLANVSVNISKDLVLKLTGGIRNNSYTYDRFYNSKTTKGSPSNPNNADGINGSVQDTYTNSWSNENTLTYNHVFNEKHRLSAMALLSFQKNRYRTEGYSGRLLPNESLGMAGLNDGIAFNPVSHRSYNTRSSYGGMVNYSYDSRYLLTLNFRADGSSKFAASNRWGYFPGAAVGWNMHHEKFLSKSNVISNSKIRASYGIVGNDRVGDFSYISALTTSTNGYSFNGATPTLAVYQSNLGNADLTWERTTSIDVGYELGLFNNRVELTVDLYKRTTDDLLLNAQLPPTSGFSTAYKNIGKLENKGVELSLNARVIQTGSFSWETGFNITFNRNKVLALTEGQRNLDNAVTTDVNYNDNLYTSEIGKPSGMMVGYVWLGNYQYSDFNNTAPGVYVLKPEVPTNGKPRNTIQPGDVKYKDLNGDGVVNSDDKTIIGRGQPVHWGGFVNNFKYKGFSLNIFFQWSYGNNIYNANRITFEGNTNGRKNMNQYASYINRWTPENPTNENFRAGGEGVIGYHSSKYVEDGSYLRLKTLSLDYSLPTRYIKRLFMSSLSLNVAMQNVLTWTNYTGLDPEVSTRNNILTPGYDYSAYPQARNITFGVKANF